jgi:DNA-binding transcriptional ArsR family regulator
VTPALGLTYNQMVVGSSEAKLDGLLRALADQTRRDIVSRTLVGPVSVSGLAGAYDVSFAAVQKHVAVLERAGLVRKQAAGRERLVTAVPEEIARARACLEQLEALWRHRLTALDAVLTHPKD